MIHTKYVALLGVIAAAGLSAYSVSGMVAENASTSNLNGAGYLVGHLELTAYDENGNIKAFRQTDNVVLNRGDNCIADLIFAEDSGGCSAEAAYDFIHIGTGSNATAPAEFWDPPLPITCTTTATPSTVAITNATGTTGASTLLTTPFLNVNANINEAAIKTASGCGNGDLLAYQQFTAIPLGVNDDLTVEWTITIDGN